MILSSLSLGSISIPISEYKLLTSTINSHSPMLPYSEFNRLFKDIVIKRIFIESSETSRIRIFKLSEKNVILTRSNSEIQKSLPSSSFLHFSPKSKTYGSSKFLLSKFGRLTSSIK